MNFNEYIQGLKRHGKIAFAIDDAIKHIKKTRKAIRSSIEHLLAKGELASPAKGFYVIVPPEYQILGCLPAEYFIPYLMQYWNIKYYACLLTAANYHGASHQAVMIFQVMIEKSRPPIVCGKVKVKFIKNKNLADTPTTQINTRMSRLTISTPEGTVMDLLKYPRQSSGLSHIATVVSELQETMSPDKLLVLAESSPELAWQQRLGYILELVKTNELANVLHINLARQNRIDYIPLASYVKVPKNATRNLHWKIIENVRIESDL